VTSQLEGELGAVHSTVSPADDSAS